MTPSYTSTVDLPAVYQGDSQEPFNLRVRNKTGDVLILPTDVSCTVADLDGRYVASMSCDEVSGTIEISGLSSNQTIDMAPGFYRYFLSYTLSDGSVKTYVSGQFEVIQKPFLIDEPQGN